MHLGPLVSKSARWTSCAAVMLLVATIFNYDIEQQLGPWIAPLFGVAIWLMFVASFFIDIIRQIKNKDKEGLSRHGFVLVDCIVILIAVFFPYREVQIFRDFNGKLEKRLEVIKLIEENKLPRPYKHDHLIAHLPKDLEYLSEGGGDVIISDKNYGQADTRMLDRQSLHVQFYLFRGFLGHYSAFEYAADDRPPFQASEAKQLRQMAKNWYFIAM
ncbi:MAG: hypothetical protein KGS72_02260 [Cyanobacteria bacterium REEB67]|nr:hypothetical protein [Cyanobacteria bacterium REEB67]